MPVLSNRPLSLSSASLEAEAFRRAQSGDGESWVLIVPNRVATERLERDILHSSARALPHLNILTLADLAGELATTAFPDFRFIRDSESAMLIELSIRDLLAAGSLSFFERAARTDEAFPIARGTFELVVNTIRQLKESGVTPEDIEHDLLRSDGAGASTEIRRAQDILRIYQAYHAWLQKKKLMDTYGQTLLINERYDRSSEKELIGKDVRETFPNITDIFITGFYYLEPPSVALIARLARIPGLAVTIELAENYSNPDLFSGLIDLESKLRQEGFQKLSVEEVPRHMLAPQIGSKLFTFSENASDPQPEPSIHYLPAENPLHEVEQIARRVKLLYHSDPELRNDLSQVVIATPSPERYTPLFEEVFRKHDIPLQLTDRYHLDRSPIVQALLSLMEATRAGLRRKDIVRILASPYFDFSRLCGPEFDAANLLDVLTRHANNARLDATERALRSELEKNAAQKDSAEDTREFEYAEAEEASIRRALLDLELLARSLRPLSKELVPKAFCTTLRELLRSLRTRENVLASSTITIHIGTLENDARAYTALLRLIEEMESLFQTMGLENDKKPPTFYEHRLKAALIVARYGVRAKSSAVLVTSLAQSISQPATYLFLAGLSEGIFPAPYQPQVFLTANLQKGERRQLLEDRVLFYQAITRFGSELFLSSPKKTASGTQVNRSTVLDALDEIFTIDTLKLEEGIFSYEELYRNASRIDPPFLERLRTAYSSFPWFSSLIEQVPHATQATDARLMEAATVYRGWINPELLTDDERYALEYNRTRIWSVTQLELYARCPFRFFSHDVLGLREERTVEDGIDPLERGSALHEVLRQFLISRRERKLPNLQDLEAPELGVAYAEALALAENYFTSKSKEHPFWRIDSETLLSNDRPGGSVLWKFIEREHSLKPYDLRPRFFEVSFGGFGRATRSPVDPTLSREDAVDLGGIKVRGKIDRIDIKEKENKTSFAVIDYKSGNETPKWNEIQDGISLQLPLYLRVAEDLLRSHFPTLRGVAALYHKLMETESKSRTLGLALGTAMGTAFEKIGKSTSKGILTSEEELAQLIEQTVEKAKEYVEGVAQGEFPLVAKRLKQKSCGHCPYHAACRVEEADEAGVLL